MRRQLEIREADLREIEEARRWYAERSIDATQGFMLEVEDALDDIVAAPERWPQFTHRTRRHLVRRYP